MKKIICFLLVFFSLIINCFAFVPDQDFSLNDFDFYMEYLEQITPFIEKQTFVHLEAENLRSLGFDNSYYQIKQLQIDWQTSQLEIEELKNLYEIQIWENKYKEYPVATYVWLYLTKKLNYNNFVAAGILGNMMAEVGGGTLDLQHDLYSFGSEYFYGLCQWNKTNYLEVRGEGLIFQCNFLAETIEYELDLFGFVYHQGYKYGDFLNLNNEEDAALMFAKCYERCATSTYYVRQKNANKAYDYFIEKD